MLAFPDFSTAIAGDRPFQLTTDASVDGLGAAAEQEQADVTKRPFFFWVVPRSRKGEIGAPPIKSVPR